MCTVRLKWTSQFAVIVDGCHSSQLLSMDATKDTVFCRRIQDGKMADGSRVERGRRIGETAREKQQERVTGPANRRQRPLMITWRQSDMCD